MPTVHRENLLGNLIVSLSASSMDEHAPWTRKINSNTSRQQSPLSLGTCPIGRSETGPSEFGYLIALAITRDNQYLIVADSWNHRLQLCRNVNETRGVFLLVSKKTVRLKWYPLITAEVDICLS